MAPPKTPVEVREKLNRAIVAVMRAPEAEAKLKTIFVRASPLDVHETGDFIEAQAKLWGDVIRAAHITIEP
jgi:tripartite-type tricarboxylate transporter receptor subunit TctC